MDRLLFHPKYTYAAGTSFLCVIMRGASDYLGFFDELRGLETFAEIRVSWKLNEKGQMALQRIGVPFDQPPSQDGTLRPLLELLDHSFPPPFEIHKEVSTRSQAGGTELEDLFRFLGLARRSSGGSLVVEISLLSPSELPMATRLRYAAFINNMRRFHAQRLKLDGTAEEVEAFSQQRPRFLTEINLGDVRGLRPTAEVLYEINARIEAFDTSSSELTRTPYVHRLEGANPLSIPYALWSLQPLVKSASGMLYLPRRVRADVP